MDIPASVREKFKPAAALKNQPRSEREELLDRFLAKLNPDRAKKGMDPISVGRLVKMFELVPTHDLHAIYKNCERGRSFGGLFWHIMKPKAATDA